jgi:zinc finger CCCH domain-containing protein 13
MNEREEREHRRRRRERHERHKRERERDENYEYDHEHSRRKREKDLGSESDTTSDDDASAPKLIDGQKPRRIAFDQPSQGSTKASIDGSLKEDADRPGTYTGYVRNPPRKESRA